MVADLASRGLFSTLLLCFLVMTLSATLGSGTPGLSRSEVGVLQNVAKQLGKTNWDFSVDPCSGEGNWNVSNGGKEFDSGVACDCSFNDGTVCHVVGLSIKGENLSGVLPVELRRLRHLRQLDLSRNVLTGTVPTQWATMRLETLSLMTNRLSGPFPEVLTKITTLTDLSIEANRFNGSLPPKIGNLINMGKLIISANEFFGELPTELAKLTNLTDLRISSNNFSGRLPGFICNLKQLVKLHIQGCALEGPIPFCISNLTNLSDLRITDLKGNGSAFPDLSNLKSMKNLILRNCFIHGSIPSYIGEMKKLKNLDLSFNQLTGEIPSSFANLGRVDFMYLTGNILTGPIPGWILNRNKNADISYNNFTLQSSGPYQCLQGSINAVESYSPEVDTINTVQSCLKRNFPCSSSNKKYQYELHINCGDKGTTINGTKYEQDIEQRGATMLYLGSNWAFSSTGNFMDNDVDADNYIAANRSKLSMPNSELYKRARLSPLSLTYYGLCMMNGNYTVKLHFAEIVFADDDTFTSLGKRIFDVFIQGKVVLKDFDIKGAAGGYGKPVIKTFNASVTHNTLEIRFYWAGKGTTGIPSRGVYGPLVSAISVLPNFDPPSDSESKKIRTIIMIGVPLLVVFLILLILCICWRKRTGAKSMYSDLRGLDLQMGSFTLRQIKAATKNFDATNKIGEGGFGSVYKGSLSDGTVIAVKQLSSKSRQGNHEFINEIGMISALQHPNLVKLYGCCTEGNQLLVIYAYMENNCLARALFGKDPQSTLKLDWPTRRKICLGIARGLAYLHEESRLKIVHRDIKASNVLLDKDLNAKISDFGLAKLYEEDHSHISTRVAGTIGYMAPEYAMRGHLTAKADVYSFGVVALEIVSGKSNTNYRPKEEFVYLLDWACVLHERGTLLELVDPELGTEYSKEEAMLMLNVALLCTNASPTLRPSMSKVVSLLEGVIPVQPLLSVLSFPPKGESSRGIRRNFWEDPSGTKSVSGDAYIGSSASNSENGVDVHLLRTSQQSVD